MSRAPSSSMASHARFCQCSLNRQLRRRICRELHALQAPILKSAAGSRADRYRKHFRSFGHACLLIFHGLSGAQSLRQSFEAFATCHGIAALAGLALSDDPQDDRLCVSFSQFADSNTSRPAEFLSGIIPFLITRVRQLGQYSQSNLPLDLHVLDSTFLRVSLSLADWLPKTKDYQRRGVRVQVQYAPALDLPEHVLVTDTKINDCRGLEQAILNDATRLAALRDQTLVVDLGYYSHRRFGLLLESGVHLVSRLQPQAKVRLATNLPVQQPLPGIDGGRITLISDQHVTLGSQDNRAGAVLPGLRLVTARVVPVAKAARQGAKPVIYQLITDRWDLTAQEVVQVYLWRWQIELFFRWLKSHVHLPRLLGYSRNAVTLTVALTIAVHLLLLIVMHALGLAHRSPALLRRMVWVLAHLTSEDMTPDQIPQQLALPIDVPDPAAPT